ncbi:macrophage mannose receptor 1-like [Cheilinus undulatus]|uniref:macrophage mannose receptor 1-like n=1 Tax=Cheilinus undulatus TaxID=241271 RepID=UPI001BD4C1CA|nr:macrophage mannose receptor 1-like [Cheilinus undulatus]XP_041635895.1 macrophage mannose receptor 1-like [Cheilinus undulatus]
MKSLFLLIVIGQCFSVTCLLCEYYLIEDEMTWDEAQRYCREKYTDLATVSDMTDAQSLSELVDGKEAWIGLSSNQGRDNRQWHWSLPGLPGVNFSDIKEHFNDGEPGDHEGHHENCVRMTNGKLIDHRCSSPSGFICLNGEDHPDGRFTRIVEKKNWTQAQDYCREHHIDLASGLDIFKDDTFLKLSESLQLWLGLFRDTWTWSDGNSSSFRNWDQGLFKDGIDRKECATVLDESGQWGSDGCDEKKPFFCYNDKLILINENKTWEEALYYCRDNYTDLVSITNPHQQRWVQARAKDASTSHVWLGLRYTCVLDLWIWINDHLVCYHNWKSNELSNECYHAAAMEKESGKWVEQADDDKFNFICVLEKSQNPT